MTTETDHAREQAIAQTDHIAELLDWHEDASTCDEPDTCDWQSEIAAEHSDDLHDVDDAITAIHENALDVSVNHGWNPPGHLETAGVSLMPEEFQILLCTGGPAVRIMGELNSHGEPARAWIEYQDWGTSWTELVAYRVDTVLAYARHFYFGG